jgi:hypothetical protein
VNPAASLLFLSLYSIDLGSFVCYTDFSLTLRGKYDTDYGTSVGLRSLEAEAALFSIEEALVFDIYSRSL